MGAQDEDTRSPQAKIISFRAIYGLTQGYLADALGVSRGELISWERSSDNKPSDEQMGRCQNLNLWFAEFRSAGFSTEETIVWFASENDGLGPGRIPMSAFKAGHVTAVASLVKNFLHEHSRTKPRYEPRS